MATQACSALPLLCSKTVCWCRAIDACAACTVAVGAQANESTALGNQCSDSEGRVRRTRGISAASQSCDADGGLGCTGTPTPSDPRAGSLACGAAGASSQQARGDHGDESATRKSLDPAAPVTNSILPGANCRRRVGGRREWPEGERRALRPWRDWVQSRLCGRSLLVVVPP